MPSNIKLIFKNAIDVLKTHTHVCTRACTHMHTCTHTVSEKTGNIKTGASAGRNLNHEQLSGCEILLGDKNQTPALDVCGTSERCMP